MHEEEFIRYLCALGAVAGVTILAVTLGGQFGWWASGAVILATCAAIGIPLWNRHLERVADARAARGNAPETAKRAKEESGY